MKNPERRTRSPTPIHSDGRMPDRVAGVEAETPAHTAGAVRKGRVVHAILAGLVAVAGAVVISVAAPVPAEACTYGPYAYAVYARTPGRSLYGVMGNGTFAANPDAGCGVRFTVYGQTKVCGAWGCSYESRATNGPYQPNGTYYTLYAEQPCRGGTNRYRTKSYAVNVGGPGYTVTAYSSEPEFTC